MNRRADDDAGCPARFASFRLDPARLFVAAVIAATAALAIHLPMP